MSPESSNPNTTGDTIAPPMLAGAGAAAVIAGVGEPPPAGATQMAALPEFGGFVKATTPLSLRKPLVIGNGIKEVPVVTTWGLQGPVPAMGTNESPSLLPMKRPPQRLSSIWPCLFSPGTNSL